MLRTRCDGRSIILHFTARSRPLAITRVSATWRWTILKTTESRRDRSSRLSLTQSDRGLIERCLVAFSVDRDRLRERERQARAAMSVQAEQAAAGGGPDTRHHHHGHHNHAHHHANPHAVAAPLFRAPVRVSRYYFPFFLYHPSTSLLVPRLRKHLW